MHLSLSSTLSGLIELGISEIENQALVVVRQIDLGHVLDFSIPSSLSLLRRLIGGILLGSYSKIFFGTISTIEYKYQEALSMLEHSPTHEDFFSKFYVRRELLDIDSILSRVSDGNKVILRGGRGIGKTTELYYIKRQLEFSQNIVIYASVSGVPVSESYTVDILLLLLIRTISTISTRNIPIKFVEKLQNLIIQFVKDEEIAMSGKTYSNLTNLLDLLDKVIQRDSKISASRLTIGRKINSIIKQIVDTFNELVSSVENPEKKLVIMIDDLEKIPDIEKNFEQFISDWSNSFAQLNCGIILNMSSHLFLKYHKNITLDAYHIPALQVKNKNGTENEDGIELITQILRKRISEDYLISNDIAREAARMSGGVIIDFLDIIRSSFTKALSTKLPSINKDVLKELFLQWTEKYRNGIEGRYYQRLSKLHQDKKSEIDDGFTSLLAINAVLEYQDLDGKWYDIHPAVLPIISNGD